MEQKAHEGQVLQQAIKLSNKTIEDVANELELTDRTMYKWFLRPVLKPYMIDRVSMVLGVDLRKTYPKVFPVSAVSVMAPKPNETSEFWKNKYILAMEDNMRIKDENAALKEENQGLKIKLAKVSR